LQGNINVGMQVSSGQFLGFADCRDGSNIDIAISSQILGSYKYYSYFDVMTDTVFGNYQARGLQNISAMIIPKNVADITPPIWNDYSNPEFVQNNIFDLS
ncbi:MAG: hypothetical protein ACTSX4_00645, partial [Candidatus Helarchaeota archaeon]